MAHRKGERICMTNLSKIDGGTITATRDRKGERIAESIKRQELVEAHDRPRPEGI